MAPLKAWPYMYTEVEYTGTQLTVVKIKINKTNRVLKFKLLCCVVLCFDDFDNQSQLFLWLVLHEAVHVMSLGFI